MAAIIMDGRALSAHLMPELRANVDELKSKFGCTPSLGAILVGDDPASRQYIKNKQRIAAELGCDSRTVRMTSAQASTESLLGVIEELNVNARVNAILLQLPIPDSVDRFRLFDALRPEKDLHAVSSASVGGFYRGQWGRFIPCTPRSALPSLDYYNFPVHCV